MRLGYLILRLERLQQEQRRHPFDFAQATFAACPKGVPSSARGVRACAETVKGGSWHRLGGQGCWPAAGTDALLLCRDPVDLFLDRSLICESAPLQDRFTVLNHSLDGRKGGLLCCSYRVPNDPHTSAVCRPRAQSPLAS